MPRGSIIYLHDLVYKEIKFFGNSREFFLLLEGLPVKDCHLLGTRSFLKSTSFTTNLRIDKCRGRKLANLFKKGKHLKIENSLRISQ